MSSPDGFGHVLRGCVGAEPALLCFVVGAGASSGLHPGRMCPDPRPRELPYTLRSATAYRTGTGSHIHIKHYETSVELYGFYFMGFLLYGFSMLKIECSKKCG